ncbi:hypothetical protein [Methylocystis sp. SC2]|uniref:hypothetical protein n=1 Tax=Methylocystis sp. (strain SC2) TaxID=187303 RepID=UPI00027AF1BB|nr:hypothetical protein [Methylocystis sp. SC2]CCJ06531.1 Uncharacterized protein BN69_1080 [Methylocystis sp. SC2]
MLGSSGGAAFPASPPLAYGALMRRIAFSLVAAFAAYFAQPLWRATQNAIAETRAKPSSISISPGELPADRDGASLLTVPAPGRYSIRAKSPSGARIELVDMIAGPLDSSGAPGLRDGRIDALLDKGVYKLRVSGAKGANGKTTLSAKPFVEADASKPMLAPGRIQGGELGDLQQRSYAFDVGAEGRVSLEAIGRALSDLRVWRSDGELVDLAFEQETVETKPGRAMNRLRVEGALEPGRYVVTAYGGEKLVWAQGDTAQPFLLRLDAPALLAAGVAEGVIGPFGAARFDAPSSYDAFRLDLPQTTPARLDARRNDTKEIATISKNSRTPSVNLRLASDGKSNARLEVSGYEGQAFTLRGLRQSDRETFEASGPHLVSIDLAGEGGDEAPATALFARIESDGKTRVIASDAPRIGAGKAWRGKFNLFGPTSILFEATRDGPVAIDAKGVKVDATIEPALGAQAARADGKNAARYDLQAGYYFLRLEPKGESGGVIDVTLGPPGLSVSAPAPAPARATMSFGTQTLERDGSYLILTNVAPQLLTGPRVVALPAELDKAPLALWQDAGKDVALPVRLPKTGKIIARDSHGADVALTLADQKEQNEQRLATINIAAAEKPRALGLIFVPESTAAKPEEPGKPAPTTLSASVARPAYFDLARDETKRLRFDVPQGGLYRVETLGRMKTALRVGATVSPRLGEGDANGPGANALVTAFLRAGGYRAAVTAKESAGHLGLAVSPATLAPTAKLVDAGIARATLDSGKGAVTPIEITREGEYRIELLGLKQKWRARLEDADGWPLAAPGEMQRITRRFEKGVYRLVVMPRDVEARMVARLTPIVAAKALEGHGPHPLPFGKAQSLQWREPQARDAPRAPDVWRFTLHGDSDIELSIGEGMVGEIFKGETDSVGKVAAGRPFKSKLSAGDYRVEARSLAHDDRLDYEISLDSKELQPDAPRAVEPPTRVDFSLAKDSVVDLSSFSAIETIGVLTDHKGDVIERLQPRADDWNVALSRRLPAGDYRLALEPLGAAPSASVEAQEEPSEETEDSSNEEQVAESAEAPLSGVELRLSLLEEKNDGALTLSGEKTLNGAGAHVLALAPSPAGSLALVAARAEGDVAISIERRGADGKWRAIGVERGPAPVAAWPAADEGETRAVVWAIGGGDAPIAVSARAIERRARRLGDIALDPVDGVAGLCVAKVATPDAALVTLATQEDIAAGSMAGSLLRAARAGTLAPQAQDLWLMGRGDCAARVGVAAFDWKGAEFSLDIGEGERAHLAALAPPAGRLRLWLARSAFAQPALDGGQGVGVAKGAALALAGEAPLELWNAEGAAPMRVALNAIDVATRPAVKGGALFSGIIAPMSAQPVDMDDAAGPLALDLAGGLAAFAQPRVVFNDGAATSRILHGVKSRVLLVNLTQAPLPARIARETGENRRLDATRVFTRFFPAAGQVSLPLDAQKNDRLIVSGAGATILSDSGRVSRGDDMTLDGAGEAIIEHGPGLVAFWIERAGASPWPAAAARALNPPQRVMLEGAATRLSIKGDRPALLKATGGAPAIVSFTQNGRRETFAFANGVDLYRYMTPGEAIIDIYAPYEGTLSGALDISTQPVIEAHEGVNDAVAVSPGARALFSFEVKEARDIGLGVRAEPDRVTARLFDAQGKTLGEGVAQTVKLSPGRYFVEARTPADAPTTTIRVAIVGLSPPVNAPPAEIVAELLDKAGMKKSKAQ